MHRKNPTATDSRGRSADERHTPDATPSAPAPLAGWGMLAACLLLIAGCGTNEPTNSGGISLGDVGLSDLAWLGQQDNGAATGSETMSGSCPGGDYCPCVAADDCDSAFCIQGIDKQECAQICVDTCKDDYACVLVSTGGTDTAQICVSKHGRICDPCTSEADCKAIGVEGATCVDYGQELGKFCGSTCSQTADCPAGYGCVTAKTSSGSDSKQCVRLGDGGKGFGTCGCSVWATKQGKHTTCAVLTARAGRAPIACLGKRTCGAAGLSACDATPAEGDTCDGVDNDCDGQTDNGACDDKEECTIDACQVTDGVFACSHKAIDAVKCEDGNLCTEKDVCKSGVCSSGTAKNCDDQLSCTLDECDKDLGCVYSDKTGPCDDGDACTVGEVCKGKICEGGQVKDCSDGKACSSGACNKTTGDCTTTLKPDGSTCDDGSKCTIGDACSAGACAGKKLVCDDGSPCTVDACEPAKGCVHAAQGGYCDDGDPCTKTSICKAGACVGLGKIACDDSNPCTDDSCNAKGDCLYTANIKLCEDGDPCTGGDQCALKKCNAGKPKDCDDKNVCTTDSCKPGQGCVHVANTAKCDDGSVCTVGETCTAGACTPASKLNCDDTKVCTVDACDPVKGCVHTVANMPCDDGNKCTSGDLCQAGACVPGKQQSCDDGNACTTDSCDKVKGCVQQASTQPCDDGNKCTTGDACAKGACQAGKKLSCDDGESCTADSCDPKIGCGHTAQGGACSDDNACTVSDVCKDGKCVGKSIGDCNDNNPCTKDNCTPSGGCVYVANTDACDDGNACTVGDKCGNKVCQAGKAKTCDDNDPCTTDGCNKAAGCTTVNNSATCDDGDACTTNDTCQGGKCAGGGAKTCNDGNPCTTDSCDKVAGCKTAYNTAPCNDGNLCTLNDKCSGGQCQGGSTKDCSGFSDTCNKGVCSNGSCGKQPKNGSCSDGDNCTINDSCSNGACKGTPKQCTTSNPCKAGYCSGGSCYTKNKSGGCSDGDNCTYNDTCSFGSCKGTPKQCTTSNPCRTAYCSSSSGGCTTKYKSGYCSDGDKCTVNDKCSYGSCKGSPKQCSTNNPCKTAFCSSSSGSCLTKNKSSGSYCSGGKCDGYGSCKAQGVPYTVDGCTGGNYVSSCKKGCEACKMQCLQCSYPGGFLAYNQTGCSGYTCFNRWPNHGNSGFVVMYTRGYQTAYAEWRFPKALQGNNRIYVDLPNPQSWGLKPSVGCSSWKYAYSAKYNLKKGGSTAGSKTISHASDKGKSVQLFSGDLTGVTGVTLGNGTSPSGCYMMLLDRMRVVPY